CARRGYDGYLYYFDYW
nr:immunoglobulin heavy chain junction region [Mus musculus]